MEDLVPIIIIGIICIQVFFFIKNFFRMRKFRKIFSHESSWQLTRNSETDLVDGVTGYGNSIFESIINSINKYLGNNAGSVIDFGLLKDAVDRHCDSVENDIATQTPIPLYWGLAGTMAGVIIGLKDLLESDAILTLMGSSGGVINVAAENAAIGINSLLSGVAWAMLASIIGILLTTFNSLLFKRCKLKEESGKNSFLAWMQSELLPQLPSDTSQALNNLVKNLNTFNSTFRANTSNLGDALLAVNQSYAIQADIIRAVHDMDVMKMAQANIEVLHELKECTDKLESFNNYLSEIEGYTDAIHRFEAQFEEQSNRLHVLQEIRDFFGRHKSEIAKTTADADHVLQESLQNIRESTADNVNALHARFVEQSEQFRTILRQEKEEFEELTSEMRAQFSAQMSQMPQIGRRLDEISSIPEKLNKLIEKVENSNSKLSIDITTALKQTIKSTRRDGEGGGNISGSTLPSWMIYTGLTTFIIIALACVFNIVLYFHPLNDSDKAPVPQQNIETSNPDQSKVKSNDTTKISKKPMTTEKVNDNMTPNDSLKVKSEK